MEKGGPWLLVRQDSLTLWFRKWKLRVGSKVRHEHGGSVRINRGGKKVGQPLRRAKTLHVQGRLGGRGKGGSGYHMSTVERQLSMLQGGETDARNVWYVQPCTTRQQVCVPQGVTRKQRGACVDGQEVHNRGGSLALNSVSGRCNVDRGK